ncbi:hypothetical protein NMY22_g5831 [Coprinellus aureogranulatus]|nr:hypothetical protein NMY22_g5831 [Coprinellus aureogranulatus]
MDSLQPILDQLHHLIPSQQQLQAVLEPILSKLPHDWNVPSGLTSTSDPTPASVKFIPGSILVALFVWPLLRRFVLRNPLDKVPGPQGGPLLTGMSPSLPTAHKAKEYSGHLTSVFNPKAWDFHAMLAEKYGRIVKLNGFLRSPMLFVYDPKALYHIFVKDQHTFEESDSFVGTNSVAFGDGLLSTLRDHHKKQRKMLNPVFSIGHMRKMIPTFFDITFQLRDKFLEKTANGPVELDMSPWMTSTALEIISQCGLGQSFGTLANDSGEHEYITAIKMLLTMVMPTIYRLGLSNSRILRFLVILAGIPFRRLRMLREKIDIMHQTSVAIFNAKKKAMEAGRGADQKDFLSILMRENANASKEDQLPDSEVIAQISTLMFAAMDTTSNALCRILWLLSKNQDVQDKLRAEIREAKQKFGDGDLDYDQLGSLIYLDAVIKETLRRYSPATFVTRESNKDAILPLSKPIQTTDGNTTQEIYVPKGTLAVVSITSVNTDPEIWGPDSYEWKPERWLQPLPDSVVDAKIPGVYSHLMTFIGGGRACIGFKFSEMEMKVVLYSLLDRFKFSLSKEIYWSMIGIATPSSNPDMEAFQSDMPLLVSRAE